MVLAHPYFAESIGDNFSRIHCTILGKKENKKSMIGNNVSMGTHSMVIGDVHV